MNTVYLIKLIKRYASAQVALSWKGSQHPDDWDDIDNEADISRKALFGYIERHSPTPRRKNG